MGKQYSTDMLNAGDRFVVTGFTSYPKLTHVIDGEELQEEIKRATQQGRVPTTTPHTYTTLVDAQVEYANPNAPTLAERYAAERMYTNKDGKTCYTAMRKSSTLADYGVVDPNDYTKVNGIYLDPDKILANGLFVKCYFRVFDTKAGMHKGVSLDAIIFQQPVEYYNFSNTSNELSERGLTWTPPKGEAPQYNPTAAATVPAAPENTAYAIPPAPQPAPVPQNTAPAPQPVPQPAPAPQNTAPQPVPQAPQPAYGAQQPYVPNVGTPQPAAPQPATVPQNTAPAPQPVPQPAPAPQPAPMPAPQPQPVQQPAPVPQQEIGNTGSGSAFDGAYSPYV